MRRARPPRRNAPANEEPISPTPINASRATRGSAIAPLQKLFERRDHRSVLVLQADGEAQEIAHAVGGDGPRQNAAGLQKGEGLLRAPGAFGGKAGGDEVADAGQDLEAEPRKLA